MNMKITLTEDMVRHLPTTDLPNTVHVMADGDIQMLYALSNGKRFHEGTFVFDLIPASDERFRRWSNAFTDAWARNEEHLIDSSIVIEDDTVLMPWDRSDGAA